MPALSLPMPPTRAPTPALAHTRATFRRPAFFVLGAGALAAVIVAAGAALGVLAGVAALLAVALGLVCVERPYVGAYVLVTIAPAASGLKRGLPIPGLRISEALIAGLATIVLVTAARSRRARWTSFDWLALAYVIGTFALGGADMLARGEALSSEALGSMIGPLQFFLLYRAVRVALPEARQRSRALALILLGSVPVTLLTMMQQFNVLGAKALIARITDVGERSLTFKYQQLSERVTGPFPHWQVLSAYLFAVFLVGAVVLLAKRRDVLPRWALAGVMLLLAVSLAATVTITTILATIVGCLALGVWYGRGLQMGAVLAAVAAVAVLLFGSLFAQRYEDQAQTRSATAHSSILPQTVAFRVSVWERHYIPLVGQYLPSGYGPLLPKNIGFKYPESLYLQLLLRGGVPLLLIYAGLIVALLAALRAGLRLAEGRRAAHAAKRAEDAAERTEDAAGDIAIGRCVVVMAILLIPMHFVEPYFTTTGMPHVFWALAGLAPLASSRSLRLSRRSA